MIKNTSRRDIATSVSFFDSSRGRGAVLACSRGIVAVILPGSEIELAAEMARFPNVSGENATSRRGADLLRRYFAGETVSFDVPVDDSGWTSFQQRVYQAVAQIPYGKVERYGEVACRSGSPKGARGVGAAMAANPVPIIIPCHRVVGSAGGMTGYSAPGGVATKKVLLAMEGVVLDASGRVVLQKKARPDR